MSTKGQFAAKPMTVPRKDMSGMSTHGDQHYREDLVGKAISTLLSSGVVKREELFIQTKRVFPTDRFEVRFAS